MQPNELPPTKPTKSSSSVLRYVLPMILLVAVIGGVAWVVQYLPSLTKGSSKKNLLPPQTFKPLTQFPRSLAQWSVTKVKNPGDPLNKEDVEEKEYEYGSEGHYDFPFKNISGKDIEVLHYTSTCDCTSVRVCAVSMAEFDKLVAQQSKKPGESLSYGTEPTWIDLQSDRQQAREGTDPKRVLTVKADEGGVVRVRWHVKKTAGQTLRVAPHIVLRPAGVPDLQAAMLGVPVKVGSALRFTPSRVVMGTIVPGAKPVTGEFDAWSSTRDKFDLKLSTLPANPFFAIETRPLGAKEIADLEMVVRSQYPGTRIKAAYHVSVTVHEAKDGKQLDQGPFFQKLAIEMDNVFQPEIPGPEIVGRVQGDVQVGGADDQGKIIFKTFAAAESAVKRVELLADAKIKLEPHTHEPSWLEVKVERNKVQPDSKKHRWTLQVTVPANTPGVRSFEETDHVTLRIAGNPARYVRIGIEGHVSGQ